MRSTFLMMTLATVAACKHGGHDRHGDGTIAAPPAASGPLTEVAIAIPIRDGKTADWERKLGELVGSRYAEYETSRQRYGLTSQTTFLQRTPMGDFALIHLTSGNIGRW